MNDYKITKDTLALLPLGKRQTIVYENHDCYIIEKKINKLMDESCKYNGSSISGRLKSTSSLTGITYKAPVIVKEDESIIFFPTCSPRLRECAWINSSNINKIHNKDNKSIVEFYNNECLEFDVSYNIMNNQLSRSLLLEKNFKKRVK